MAANDADAHRAFLVNTHGARGRKPDREFRERLIAPGETQPSFHRPKPGNLILGTHRVPDAQLTMASVQFQSNPSQMGAIAGDPRLSDQVVANTAAMKIQTAFRRHKAKQNLRRAKQGGNAEEVRQAIHRKLRTNLTTSEVRQNYQDAVNQRRQEANMSAASVSEELLSRSTVIGRMGMEEKGLMPGMERKLSFAETLERSEGLAESQLGELSPLHRNFVQRMEAMAPNMRLVSYYSARDEAKILESGAMYSKLTRRQIGIGGESHTTQTDEDDLGNHDHVFFFLEHETQAMRANRFTQPSTESGQVEQREQTAEGLSPGARRLSFPLPSLMRRGAWAMRKDFLDHKGDFSVKGNFIGLNANEADPESRRQSAAHLMRQLAFSSLSQMPQEELRQQMENPEVSDKDLFNWATGKAHLHTQVMVPSMVNLHTAGARIDMPVGDYLENQHVQSETPAQGSNRPRTGQVVYRPPTTE